MIPKAGGGQRGLGIPTVIAYHRSRGPALGSLVVTHPFHPLSGERLVVLFVRRVGAGRIYVCEGGPLGSVGLPEDATDRGPEPAEGPLSIEMLGALIALVAVLTGEQGGGAMIAPSASARAVLAWARELAARLSALFERDVEIVARLNDAQRRLREANERLWSGLAPDAFGLVYDGAAPAGGSQIEALIRSVGSAGGPDSQAAVLAALQEIHWAVHRGFWAYQSACEERRQLAVDVGELSQQLSDVLCACGWSVQEARAAKVHELAVGRVR